MKQGKWFFLALFALYFFTRLYNLTLIPISNDEANYIYWAKQVATSGRGWFITLEAGKPPLYLWLIVFFLKILPSQAYLLAGRLPSVFAGFISLIATYQLGKFLFKSSKVGYLSALLYIICPFILFYDRLGFFDSLLLATTLWSVYFCLKGNFLWWGIALGFALLSKPTALIFFGLTPIIYFLSSGKRHLSRLALVFFTAILINSFLVFSRGFNDYVFRALDYTPSSGQLPFFQNANLTVSWLSDYLTLPFLLLCLLATAFLFRKNFKTALILTLLWFLPLLAFSLSARVYFPRYFLFVIPYFLLPAAWFFSRRLTAIILFIALVPIIRFDYQLLTKPENAPLPAIENWQYISGYPSSSGFDAIYQFVDQRLDHAPVTLFVWGSFSHYPHALELRYWGDPRIIIFERLPLTAIDAEMEKAKKTGEGYVVYGLGSGNPYEAALLRLPLHPVIIAKKPTGNDDVVLASY